MGDFEAFSAPVPPDDDGLMLESLVISASLDGGVPVDLFTGSVDEEVADVSLHPGRWTRGFVERSLLDQRHPAEQCLYQHHRAAKREPGMNWFCPSVLSSTAAAKRWLWTTSSSLEQRRRYRSLAR